MKAISLKAIATIILSFIAFISHANPFILIHKNGFTVSGFRKNLKNDISLQAIKTIRVTKHEISTKDFKYLQYIEELSEGRVEKKESIYEELSVIIENFKNTSVLKKLLPSTFFVSEVSSLLIDITDIQSYEGNIIAHGFITKQEDEKLTLVFKEITMPANELVNSWKLRQISLYNSYLNIDDINSAKEEISYTEIDNHQVVYQVLCNTDKTKNSFSEMSTNLFSVSTSILSIAIITVTPILAIYLPCSLYLRRLDYFN